MIVSAKSREARTATGDAIPLHDTGRAVVTRRIAWVAAARAARRLPVFQSYGVAVLPVAARRSCQIDLQETHKLLTAMHVTLPTPSLRIRSRKRNLDYVETVDRNVFDKLLPRVEQPREHHWPQARRVAEPAIVFRAIEEQIDRDPERPGVLRPHMAADVFQFRHRVSLAGSFSPA